MDSTEALIAAIEELTAARYKFEKLTDQHKDFQTSYDLPKPSEQRLLAAREQPHAALNAVNK